jgi:hypothetical protein
VLQIPMNVEVEGLMALATMFRSTTRPEVIHIQFRQIPGPISAKEPREEVRMANELLIGACAAVFALLVVQARAETVVPMNGQTPEQMESDMAACQTEAKAAYDKAVASASANTTTGTSATSGGRLRGAAVGAAAGAASAQVQGNRNENYDKLDEDVQQEYRQNQAKDAAAAGAVIGGVKQRQTRRQDRKTQQQAAQQQSDAATQSADSAYSACISARGYSLK